MTSNHIRPDSHPTAPADSRHPDPVVFRAPTAVMLDNHQSHEHDVNQARRSLTGGDSPNVTSRTPSNPVRGSTLGQGDKMALAAEKANRKRDHADHDFTPGKRRRKIAPLPSPSSKMPTRTRKEVTSQHVAKSNVGKSFEKCSGEGRAIRIKHIQGIEEIWGRDPSKWPVRLSKTSTAQTTGGSDSDITPPRDWGVPFLQATERLARATNNQAPHQKLEELLDTAVRDRNEASINKTSFSTKDVLTVLDHFLSKSRSTDTEQVVRSPTIVPEIPRASSIGEPSNLSPSRQLHAGPSTPIPASPAEVTPTTIKQEFVLAHAMPDLSNHSTEELIRLSEGLKVITSLRIQLDEAIATLRFGHQRSSNGNSIANPISVSE